MARADAKNGLAATSFRSRMSRTVGVHSLMTEFKYSRKDGWSLASGECVPFQFIIGLHMVHYPRRASNLVYGALGSRVLHCVSTGERRSAQVADRLTTRRKSFTCSICQQIRFS
jgi:hypothetical protein